MNSNKRNIAIKNYIIDKSKTKIKKRHLLILSLWLGQNAKEKFQEENH